MSDKLDFSKTFAMAGEHVRQEALVDQIMNTKKTIWKESMTANSCFEKLVDKLPSDIQQHCSIELENLIYSIGRIKASAE